MPAEEPAILIPDTEIGILICADLYTWNLLLMAKEEAKDHLKDEFLRLTGKNNLIGVNPTLIHPEAKSLVVSSCWAIGGNYIYEDTDPDEYYHQALIFNARPLLYRSEQINEMVMVDRSPLVGKDLEAITPKKPYNALLRRG